MDEMLGRLARFMRILGYDTEYARDLTDEEIRARAVREERTLLTRDSALARRTPHAIAVVATDLRGQLAELWGARPDLGRVPRFDRCTKCNGPLEPLEGRVALDIGVPPRVVHRLQDHGLYRCAHCGQPYWEGSHTERIRAFLHETDRVGFP